MISESKDVLYFALAGGVAIVAIFSAILLYHLIIIIRDFRLLSKSIRDKVELLDNILNTSRDVLKTIQDKLEHSSAYFGILIELVNKIVSHMQRRNNENNNQDNKIQDTNK